ncbi:MAG TPA: hypothetical protein DEP72_01340 [Clostridiales bacterium]|nr:MAG: hypothetical protein A2Y18_05645 [Clostridiales bacterium GWD2_32_19]HCC06797.1 hypothetical protein [Clostridiales bacterium]
MLLCEKYELNSDKVDFLDIELDGGDTQVFIDPYRIHISSEEWCKGVKDQISRYFEKLIDYAQNDQDDEARRMMKYLREINELKIGYSSNKSQGKGFSLKDGMYLYEQIKKSKVRETGMVKDIFDCQVFIPRVHRDKVSDFISNIIQKNLVEYTQKECQKYNIPMQQVNSIRYHNIDTNKWDKVKVYLPVHYGKPIILIPKTIVRSKQYFDYYNVYDKLIIPYYQTEMANPLNRLLYLASNEPITKKEVKKRFPCRREFVNEFLDTNVEKYIQFRENALGM